jgi:hypothetical protein
MKLKYRQLERFQQRPTQKREGGAFCSQTLRYESGIGASALGMVFSVIGSIFVASTARMPRLHGIRALCTMAMDSSGYLTASYFSSSSLFKTRGGAGARSCEVVTTHCLRLTKVRQANSMNDENFGCCQTPTFYQTDVADGTCR